MPAVGATGGLKPSGDASPCSGESWGQSNLIDFALFAFARTWERIMF